MWCTCGWVKREVGCDEVGVVYVWVCRGNGVGVMKWVWCMCRCSEGMVWVCRGNGVGVVK